MAKGNLILGTAGNSIGDVVMYRRDGAQVSRVRVRKVANPRTNAQSAQRSFFAPVAKFFSPLSSVLERSWEGLNKSKSYSKFLAENVKLARKNGWLLPKGTGFFPLPYQLSNGTLPTISLTYSDSVPGFGMNAEGLTETPTTFGQLSDVFIGLGYKAGDVVTYVAVVGGGTKGYSPISFQFIIDANSSQPLSDIPARLMFKVEEDIDDTLFLAHRDDELRACAVIVARFEDDKWRRSKQFLVVAPSIINNISTDEAIAAAIASYGNAATGENPLVYLDGDELQD